MKAAALVAELRARGVELVSAGDRIRFRPASAVPRELRDQLRALKPEVLGLLWAEHALSVPSPDPQTVRETLGPNPAPADLEALHHELAGALWDLRECQAGRQPWGRSILVRGRPLADWLQLEDIACILGAARKECR